MVWWEPPSMSKLLGALERDGKYKWKSWDDMCALKYYRDHRNDKEFLEKLAEARELAAARQNISSQRQPLMPTDLSNRHRSRSPNRRHGYGHHHRQRQPSPVAPLNHHRSRSPSVLQKSSWSLNTGVFAPQSVSTPLVNLHVREQCQSVTDDANDAYVSNFLRRKRSPTPINDDHFLDAQSDMPEWNPNVLTPENNNAIDTPTSSVSVSNSQEPFLMGTLKNIDNSCYMNSVLYILRMTPTFAHNIHHLLQNIEFVSDEYNDSVEMSVTAGECLQLTATSVMMSNRRKWPNVIDICTRKKEVIGQLHRTFADLTAMEVRKDNTPIEKTKLQAAVREIQPYFTQGTQQDAHEFLLTILNCIRDCGATLAKLIQDHASMFDNIIDPKSRLCFDFIEKNFIGKERTTTKCVCCETPSNCTLDMIDFYVPLPTGKTLDQNFIQESCLTKENLNKIGCEVCRRRQEKMQSKSYPQLPRILIFHLGRFDNQLNKILTITPIPLELDCFCTLCVENRDSDECIDHKYLLYGAIVHLGVTARSGHYMAYARTFDNQPHQQQPKYQCNSSDCCQLKFEPLPSDQWNEAGNGAWYNCNDELISVITETEFQTKINHEGSTNTPYILFYVRNDLLANY